MLNSSNHRPGSPIHWLSYHFYAATPDFTLTDAALESLFQQADIFLAKVVEIQRFIDLYTATSVTGKRPHNYIDKIGCMAGDGVGSPPMDAAQTLYWNACGAM